MGNETLASLSPPVVLAILIALGAVRLFLRGKRALFFTWLSELCAIAMKALAFIFLLVRPFLVQTYALSSGSMEPTLYRGEGIVVDKWTYRSRSPLYGEVVVFRTPEGDERETIKRVIGLPGDVLEGRSGFVLLSEPGKPPLRLGHAELRERLKYSPGERLVLNRQGVWRGQDLLSSKVLAKELGHPGSFVAIESGYVARGGQRLGEGMFTNEDLAEPFGPVTVPAGHAFLLGDNRNRSHDSRFFGPLPMNRLVGRATWVLWPASHLRPVFRKEALPGAR